MTATTDNPFFGDPLMTGKVKLTETQRAVLKRLAGGPYYPAGRHIMSARSLTDKGLAHFYRPTLCFCITPAGREALEGGE